MVGGIIPLRRATSSRYDGRLGQESADAVKQIVLARIEKRPARLDLAAYPYLPQTSVRTTLATDYAVLLSGSLA
jgi:hypothetical protein